MARLSPRPHRSIHRHPAPFLRPQSRSAMISRSSRRVGSPQMPLVRLGDELAKRDIARINERAQPERRSVRHRLDSPGDDELLDARHDAHRAKADRGQAGAAEAVDRKADRVDGVARIKCGHSRNARTLPNRVPQPAITSSTSRGSRPLRSASTLSTDDRIRGGWTSASAPFVDIADTSRSARNVNDRRFRHVASFSRIEPMR